MVSAPFPTLQSLPFERIYCDEDALFLRPVRHRVLVIGRAVLLDFLLDHSYQYLCLDRCTHKKNERFTAYLVTLADLLKFRFQEFAGIKPFLIQNETVDVIMKNLDLTVILAVKDEGLIIVIWIMAHCRPHDFC